MNMKDGFSKKLLPVVAFIAAFIAIKYGMETYREHETVAKAGKTLDKIKADAIQKHPDDPISMAMQQEATEVTTKMITSQTDDLKRANISADIFWGFYFINVRERPEFCREQEVDIQPFVEEFERSHITEVSKARAIYAKVLADENKTYALIKSQLRKAIVQDMNDIATMHKISVKEACKLVSENANALVKEMHLSKLQPVVFQALSSAK